MRDPRESEPESVLTSELLISFDEDDAGETVVDVVRVDVPASDPG